MVKFTKASNELTEYKNRVFPIGSVVHVECKEHFSGFGVVFKDADAACVSGIVVQCKIKREAMEIMELYRYPVECCRHSEIHKDWPEWIKQEKTHAAPIVKP